MSFSSWAHKPSVISVPVCKMETCIVKNETINKPIGVWHCLVPKRWKHYGDVIMGTIASQITSLTIVYSTVDSDADQKIHQSSASLAFVCGIHRRPVNFSLLLIDRKMNKANLRDLIAATGLVILLKLDLNRSIFQPVWPWYLMDDPKKQ